MQASLILRATAWRAGREEENDGDKSIIGIETKDVLVVVDASRERRYFSDSSAAVRVSL